VRQLLAGLSREGKKKVGIHKAQGEEGEKKKTVKLKWNRGCQKKTTVCFDKSPGGMNWRDGYEGKVGRVFTTQQGQRFLTRGDWGGRGRDAHRERRAEANTKSIQGENQKFQLQEKKSRDGRKMFRSRKKWGKNQGS